MTNTELMRKFFYNLPEALEADGTGWTEKWFNARSPKEVVAFIDGLHMDYPTPELQAVFEQNKRTWKLAVEMGSAGACMFLDF